MTFVILMATTFFQAFIDMTVFYIFFPPDYVCLDPDFSNPTPCPRERACRPGQNFIFDSSRP